MQIFDVRYIKQTKIGHYEIQRRRSSSQVDEFTMPSKFITVTQGWH